MLAFPDFYFIGPVWWQKENRICLKQTRSKSGGDEEDRTLDLTDANRTLSQLSYAPKDIFYFITPFRICTETIHCENNEFIYKNKCKLHESMSVKTVWAVYLRSELQTDTLFHGNKEQ